MLPGILTLIPKFIMWKSVDRIVTFTPLTVAAWFVWGPCFVFLLRQFFLTIPRDIEEAARVDGCSRLGAIVRVVLPLSLAGILTTIIFTFTLVMQEFVYGLTFITSASQKTISVGVPTDLVRGDVYYWGPLMAGCLLSSVPVAILYNFFLDRFIAGFTVGAIK